MMVHIRYSAKRKRPKTGETRLTKKYGLQYRLPVKIDGCYVVSGGRQQYYWCNANELPSQYVYLLRTNHETNT